MQVAYNLAMNQPASQLHHITDTFRPDRTGLVLGAALLLVVPWLSGGKDIISLVCVFAGALVVLALSWRMQPRLYGGRIVLGLYSALLVWTTVSQLWSVNRYESQLFAIVLGLAGLAFQLGYMLRTRPDAAQKWWVGYQLTAVTTGAYGLYVYMLGDYDRVISTFYWPNPLAVWLLPALLIGLWWVIGLGRWRWLPVVAITGAAFGLANSRSSIVLLAGVVAVLGILVLRQKRSINWLLLAAVIGLSVIVGASAVYVRSVAGKTVTVTNAQRFTEVASGKSTSIDDRLQYLDSAQQMWRAKPLTGWGAGTYGDVHPQYQGRVISAGSSVHNTYVQTFAELGVVGGLLLLALAVVLLFEVVRGARSGSGWVAAAAALALLVHISVDIDARYPAIVALLGVLLGLTVRQRDAKDGRPVLGGLILMAVVGLMVGFGALTSYRQASDGDVYRSQSEYDRARDEYAAAQSLLIYDPQVVLSEGIMVYSGAFMLKDDQRTVAIRETVAVADRAIKITPRSAAAWQLKGRALRSLGDTAGAEAAFRRALELDPFNQPSYYSDLGNVLLYTRQSGVAISVLNYALRLYTPEVVKNRALQNDFGTEVVGLYQMLGRAYRDAGSLDEAVRADADMQVFAKAAGIALRP